MTTSKVNAQKSSTDIRILQKISVYIKPHLLLLGIAALFLFVTIGVELIRPLILKHVIDKGLLKDNISLVFTMAGYYFITIIVGMIASFLQSYMLKRFGQEIIFAIRNDVFDKIIRKSQSSFEKIPLGNLVTRVTNDAESLRALFTDVLLKMISSVLLLVGILIFMFFLNVELAILTFIMIPIMFIITSIYRKYARKAFRGVRSKIADSNAYVQEVLNFIIIIKTYVGERIVAQRYKNVSEQYLAAGLYEVSTFAIFRPIIDVLYFIAVIAILSLTNWWDRAIDAGIVFAALQYVQKIFQPLQDIADKYNMLQQSLAGAERLVPILEEESALTLEPINIPEELKPIRTIVFDKVSFAYEEDKYVLEDISFTINKGDFIGIVGPTGSGKTTLMSLLLGFIEPTKGSIFINGHDSKKYSPQVLRELIGYVFQDSHLFKGTIRDNLALYEDIPEERMIEATQKAHLYERIMRLNQGFDTPVGYLGSLLSGGEKQLLSLARALVKEKPILVFDEATANIDSETERLIQESIEEVRGAKTIFSIAHRLSTIQKADHIFYLKEGHIIESGSYEALMRYKGSFYELWSEVHETD